MITEKNLNGTSSTKVCNCGYKSISGLKPGISLCPFHYASHQYGVNWAAKCYPLHPEAIKINNPNPVNYPRTDI